MLETGRQQAALRAETQAQAEKIAAAEVFSLALKNAAAAMARAAELLQKQRTGADTLKAENEALSR